MKILKYLALGFLIVSLTPVFGQPARTVVLTGALNQQSEPAALTKFNLDFTGGPPAELVKIIEKATGKPLNAIISDEDAGTKLPPLKMSDVDVAQLFQALEQISVKPVAIIDSRFGNQSYSTFMSGYGFKTQGQISDDSIWYFHVEKPSFPPMVSTEKVCQFYSLDAYLNRGFTVDDITTAIQTGWKMAGITPLPDLNYHKETKLLIAFGEPKELQTIQQVLQTLPQSAQSYDISTLKSQVSQLQKQVDQLNKKISTSATNVAPEEKSGK